MQKIIVNGETPSSTDRISAALARLSDMQNFGDVILDVPRKYPSYGEGV